MVVQGREKIELIYTFTQMGFDILVSDVDCVWCGTPAAALPLHCDARMTQCALSAEGWSAGLIRLQDPLPYMARYPDAQILTSSDHLVLSSAFA
jgi:hypothetical protein